MKIVQTLSKQEEHLSALRKQREIQLILDPRYIDFQDSRQRKREIERQWHDEILKWDPLTNWPPDDDRSLYEILSPFSIDQEQPWTTWQYQAAYPKTANFLVQATSPPRGNQDIPQYILSSVKKSRSIVSYYSFFQTGDLVENWSSKDPYTQKLGKKLPIPERIWEIVRHRRVAGRASEAETAGERIPSRLLCIVDLSPVIAAILLASTPKYVLLHNVPYK